MDVELQMKGIFEERICQGKKKYLCGKKSITIKVEQEIKLFNTQILRINFFAQNNFNDS